MHFAIRLPSSNRVASPQAIADAARAAEDRGFWAVSVHDHLVFNGDWVACGAADATGDGDDRDMYEALTTLAYVGGRTTSIALMTAILLLPVREVVLTAKQLATIDALTGGRMVVGVGIGAASRPGDAPRPMRLGGHAANAQKENATFRVPPRRGKLVDEQLEAMRAIWTEDRATMRGQHVAFDAIEVFPKPAQPGGPPILVGGNSDAAMRRVVAHGDGWLPTALSPAEYGAAADRLSAMAREAGRPEPLRALNIFTAVASTESAARELAAASLGGRFDPAQLAERNLVGTPAALAERVAEYAEAGVGLIELKPVYRSAGELIEVMDAVATHVMPHVASAAEPA